MKFSRVLIVCTGNICRSVMGEALLKRDADLHGWDVAVESAGIGALKGQAADPNVVALMRDRGLDVRGHRGRQLDSEMLKSADLVWVMEKKQEEWIVSRYPAARGKVHLLGKWSGVEIEDPYRQPRLVFELVLRKIEEELALWEEKLWARG